ncbi:MAG: hypothetical protein H0W53_19920 [Acidobacteria bacterium]|nr:hypothetical protein [Acidobacteriota bacterium]
MSGQIDGVADARACRRSTPVRTFASRFSIAPRSPRRTPNGLSDAPIASLTMAPTSDPPPIARLRNRAGKRLIARSASGSTAALAPMSSIAVWREAICPASSPVASR